MVESTASNRATLSSMFGSTLFRAFSLNASMTFQMSTRCTAYNESRVDASAQSAWKLDSLFHMYHLSGFAEVPRYVFHCCGGSHLQRKVHTAGSQRADVQHITANQ